MGTSTEIRDYVAARGASLARAAYLLTGDRAAAEDLVQETYVVMVRQWRRIDRHNPDPYVRRIMYSRFVDSWRRRHGLVEEPSGLGDDPAQGSRAAASPASEDPSATTVDRLVLREALLSLTPKQRALLVLRFYEDLTEVQTAHALGVSPSTVKSETRAALRRLRDLAPAVVSFAVPEEGVR
jgi:RNA polymerase sigma-70 factor (sigma-E family)